MKKSLTLILSVFLGIQFYAQEEFSFPLYITDALGNHDTIILGYDQLASDAIETVFGEEELLNQPWTSDLEVRASIHDFVQDQPYNQSKKQIITKTCSINNAVCADIHAVNYPVTLKWNPLLFSVENCRVASVISFIESFSWDVGPDMWRFMSPEYGDTDSLVLLSNQSTTYSYWFDNEEIPVVWIRFSNAEGVMTGLQETDPNQPVFFPNPIQQNQLINLEKDADYTLMDLTGKACLSGKTLNKQIKTNDLIPGSYFILFTIDDNQFVSKLIVE